MVNTFIDLVLIIMNLENMISVVTPYDVIGIQPFCENFGYASIYKEVVSDLTIVVFLMGF